MARIDGLLNIMLSQGATELHLGCERTPRLLRDGQAQPFHMPELSEEMLRSLLGPLLSDERQATMKDDGRTRFDYVAGRFNFHVELNGRGPGSTGFDVIFRAGGAAPTAIAVEAEPVDPSSAEPQGPPYEDAAGSSQPRPLGAEESSARSSSPGPPEMRAVSGGERSYRAPEHAFVKTTASRAVRRLHGEIQRLLLMASDAGASDIHLGEGEPVVIRVAGRLRRLAEGLSQPMETLVEALTNGEPLGEQALDVALELEGVGRMRANLYRAQGRIHGAIRLLPRTIPRLDSLGLPLDISDWGRFPNGLVLVGGATGSGKSTTMAALTLRALQSTPQVAITIEEPIEFQFDGASHQSIIRQREVGRDVSDFHRGLREALREDPDLIVVGEMRDPESISLALTAAETGHLVFTTLHSRSAASVVERIVDSYPPLRQQQIRVQLADSLRAVLSQRLLPHKSEPRRVLVAEVLRVTTNVAALIREGKTAQLVSAMQSGRSEGMLPLERCLADRVADGSISLDTARGAANDRQVLDHYLRAR